MTGGKFTSDIIRQKNITGFILVMFAITCFTGFSPVNAQLSAGGSPPGFLYDLNREPPDRQILRAPDLSAVLKEDSLFPSPYRFGIILPVDLDMERSGTWTILPDGTRIWRVSVSAPGALAMSAYFSGFYIPEGGKLFIYNTSRSMVAGAFTERNNSKNGLFSTQLIEGDEIILEYVEPSGSDDRPVLLLNEITYAYRGVAFRESRSGSGTLAGKCEVNVNCPEGDNWQDQKRGVLKIHVKRAGGTYWCTGSLINNTREDNTPYVLTANHCAFNSTEQELEQWVFYFDYETEGCQFTGYPKPKTMTGAVLKANSGTELTTGSDFYLVQLSGEIPDTFDVFFNGWSRSETTPSPSGVCIHHPGGDLKKISTYTQTLTTATWMGNPDPTHWKVYWAATVSGHGVTEGGSSGCPLFDNHGRVIGFLSGGESACDSFHISLPDYCGKFSWAWSSDGTDSTNTLMHWLDPDSTNLMVLDGRYTDSIGKIIIPDNQVYPNPFTNQITVQLTDISHTGIAVSVYDISGRKTYSGKYYINGIGSFNVPLGFLVPGLYFLRVEAGDVRYSWKILKQ